MRHGDVDQVRSVLLRDPIEPPAERRLQLLHCPTRSPSTPCARAGKVYVQVVVDVFCSIAFAKVYTAKMPATACDLLYDRILPLYEALGVTVGAILTDDGPWNIATTAGTRIPIAANHLERAA